MPPSRRQQKPKPKLLAPKKKKYKRNEGIELPPPGEMSDTPLPMPPLEYPNGAPPAANRPGSGGNRPGSGGGKKRRKKPGKKKPKKQGFVDKEIGAMITADKQLTNYTDAATKKIIADMEASAAKYAAIAGKYQPTAEYANPTASDHTLRTIAENAGLVNTVAKDQANAIASLIANSGRADIGLVGGMRAAGRRQHQEYAQRMRGLAPHLKMQRMGELADDRVKQAQIDLSKQIQLAELGLSQQEINRKIANDRADAINDSAKIAASSRDKGKAAKNARAAELRKATRDLRKSLFYYEDVSGEFGQPDKQEWRHPKQQFRTAFGRLLELGHKPAAAAALAARWARDSEVQAKKVDGITFRPGQDQNFYNILVANGVSRRAAAALTAKYWQGFRPYQGPPPPGLVI